jgi:hypothetical protein
LTSRRSAKGAGRLILFNRRTRFCSSLIELKDTEHLGVTDRGKSEPQQYPGREKQSTNGSRNHFKLRFHAVVRFSIGNTGLPRSSKSPELDLPGPKMYDGIADIRVGSDVYAGFIAQYPMPDAATWHCANPVV